MKALSICALWLLASTAACKRKSEPVEGAPPPPPVVSSQRGACGSGGGEIKDGISAAYFPRVSGDYCVDPNGDAKTFGEQGAAALDAVCDLFDGECEVYKNFGLKRVVTVQYVDGNGSPGNVTVTLSRFASSEAAYAFFTKRVVADADPLESAPAPIPGGSAAALGSGMAYVFRGELVAELRYVHELESPDQLRASSARILPLIAREIGERLPGDKSLPPSVQKLPEANRIASGVSYEYRDLLSVSGAGRGAVGFYKNGELRYRIFVAVRPDEDSAKDVIKTLKKLEGAKSAKDSPIDAVSVGLHETEGGPKVEWLVGRSGSLVAGVGDESFVVNAAARAAGPKPTLPESERQALLRSVLSGAKAAPAPSPSAP
ncbi:MAG: hypothetical protein QM756_30500 [Polyangiaceae bacterium]